MKIHQLKNSVLFTIQATVYIYQEGYIKASDESRCIYINIYIDQFFYEKKILSFFSWNKYSGCDRDRSSSNHTDNTL